MSKETLNNDNDNNNSKDGYNGDSISKVSPLPPSKENMEKMARVAARTKAMEGDFEILPHGGKIYFVAKGWESSIIENDPVVKCVNNLQEFKDAFCDADITTIFIPWSVSGEIAEKNVLMLSQIRKICERYAVSKTIYMEGKEEKND